MKIYYLKTQIYPKDTFRGLRKALTHFLEAMIFFALIGLMVWGISKAMAKGDDNYCRLYPAATYCTIK